jgi:hypothetical protein
MISDLGFYGGPPSRTFRRTGPYLCVGFVSSVVETLHRSKFHWAGPFFAFAFFAVESTAREKIRSIGEICAKSSFHQPSFIAPALNTEHLTIHSASEDDEAPPRSSSRPSHKAVSSHAQSRGAGPFVAFAFFAVESTAREEIRSIGEISAKSSFHQPSFIVPVLKTAN